MENIHGQPGPAKFAEASIDALQILASNYDLLPTGASQDAALTAWEVLGWLHTQSTPHSGLWSLTEAVDVIPLALRYDPELPRTGKLWATRASADRFARSRDTSYPDEYSGASLSYAEWLLCVKSAARWFLSLELELVGDEDRSLGRQIYDDMRDNEEVAILEKLQEVAGQHEAACLELLAKDNNFRRYMEFMCRHLGQLKRMLSEHGLTHPDNQPEWARLLLE